MKDTPSRPAAVTAEITTVTRSTANKLGLPEPGRLGRMEIAGSTCTICGQHVVLAREGKSCPACQIVVHCVCDAHGACAHCGRPYEVPEPPIVDLVRDTVLPRSLRTSLNATPVAMLALAVLLLFFLVLIFAMWAHH